LSIRNVSDTALWVAVYRAMESERRDAHFRDPYARRLAGERGEAIVRAMPRGRQTAWPMIVRTQVLDEVILDRVAAGADCVLNLAAGLDARPWRLDLPGTLRWIDVDLPEILAYKTDALRGDDPRCTYEAVAADLTDPEARRMLFDRVGSEWRRVLVVTEGLLIYLDPGDVEQLAEALHAQQSFRWWVTDLGTPELLKRLKRLWGKHLGAGNAPFRFAPSNGSAFFERFGWREREWHSTVEDALRLRRGMNPRWLMALLIRLAPQSRRETMRRYSGNLLLERI
jgi:methyltransferase (TIGR00027 family)